MVNIPRSEFETLQAEQYYPNSKYFPLPKKNLN